MIAFRRLPWIAVLLCGAALAHAEESNLRQKAREVYSSLERRVADPSTAGIERAESALRIGQLSTHPDLLDSLRPDHAMRADILQAEEMLRMYRFDEAKRIVDAYAGQHGPELDRLRYRWLFVSEDLATADSLTQVELRSDSTNPIALWARGELLYRLVRWDESASMFASALHRATTQREAADARLGLARVYTKKNEQQRGLDTLLACLHADMLSSDVLHQMGLLLIDLSRVSEAIDLVEEAVRWNPNSELAHYYLGNGYARLNYTQLREKYPSQVGDSAAVRSLDRTLDYCRTGQWEWAHVAAMTSFTQYPDAVEPLTLLGSIAWNDARLDDAADYFRSALEHCPEYGRAHNGLAKSLEAKRMRVNVHRAADSLRFASQAMPEVAGIDSFVINWSSLAPRHRKQVALAMDPWKLYIPTLAESGHRYYIKPLHELLSESPGLGTLKDQRIGYDSRLWDDVRGCGGFTTVTGIEDVERSIYANYNTVLHELTHQVHGVFPPEDQQRLTDRYKEARNLEAAGTKVFMSEYQSASVWEYFAEGANAYYSPRRDAYDTREIVRERLFALDTPLVNLVAYYVKAPNLEQCYPVSMIDAADDAIGQQNLDQALAFAKKAYTRTPHAEVVLSSLSHIYSLLDRKDKSIAFADSLRTFYPQKAGSYIRWKEAMFFKNGDATAAIKNLQPGLQKVDSTEESQLRQALGDALWFAGRYPEAVEQYRTILSRHDKDSGALWGLGLALGESGKYAEADSVFKLALLERSGITDLRLDYARILIQADQLPAAEVQIHEAEVLAPDDPQVLIMKGWLELAKGNAETALAVLDSSIRVWTNDRLPQVLRIEALRKTGKLDLAQKRLKRLVEAQKTDTPRWVYHSVKASYVQADLWPQFQIELLKQQTKKR